MRYHFAADFRKPREATFDVKKSVFVEPANVAGLQPVVAQNFCSSFLIVQIAFENIDPAQPKHSGIEQRKFSTGLRFTDLCSDTRRESPN